MAERMGDQSALKWKEGDVWRNLTWRDFRQTVLEVASGLRALGFKPGDFSALGAFMHLQNAEVCACEKQLS